MRTLVAMVVCTAMLLGACDIRNGVNIAANPATRAAGPGAPGVPIAYATVPVGNQLPTGSSCAANRAATPIPERWRPQNNAANTTIVNAGSVQVAAARGDFNQRLAGRIDGNFAGTTEEIILWGACKWGFDENLIRAMAANESWWLQSTRGDYTTDVSLCALIGLTAPCYQSYGLIQVKGTVHLGTYPYSQQSTAFAVDYGLAVLRACYEGAYTWLGNGYAAGDLLGCVGTYFSGSWYDGAGRNYIAEIQRLRSEQPWTNPDFIHV